MKIFLFRHKNVKYSHKNSDLTYAQKCMHFKMITLRIITFKASIKLHSVVVAIVRHLDGFLSGPQRTNVQSVGAALSVPPPPRPVFILIGLAGVTPPSVFTLVGVEGEASAFSGSFCVSDLNTASVSFFQEHSGPLLRGPAATTDQSAEPAGRREGKWRPGRECAGLQPRCLLTQNSGGAGLVPFAPRVLCVPGSRPRRGSPLLCPRSPGCPTR